MIPRPKCWTRLQITQRSFSRRTSYTSLTVGPFLDKLVRLDTAEILKLGSPFRVEWS